MKHILYLLTFAMAVFAVSCSGSTAGDLALAETAVDRGDYATAKGICDELSSADGASMGVSDLLRLSIVYMKLGDIDEAGDNTASAIGCYSRAAKINADSVSAFAVRLPASDLRYFKIVSSLEELSGRLQSIDEFEFDEAEFIEAFAGDGESSDTDNDNQ